MPPTGRPIIAVAWPKPDYEFALREAGADVRVLTPDTPLPGALDGVDGVLLTGGVDVDPQLYGADETHPTVEIDPVRDDYELTLARLVLARDLPLLAICRGVQVLNVAAGGTLVQDIPSAVPDAVAHAVDDSATAHAHTVHVEAGSRLQALLDSTLDADRHVHVNSRHHQSVDALAPGFAVAATAPDGVIEAIEKPDARFCLGVQWHPENYWQDGAFAELFRGLVDAALTRRA